MFMMRSCSYIYIIFLYLFQILLPLKWNSVGSVEVDVDRGGKVLPNFIFISCDTAQQQTTSDMVTLDKYKPLFTIQKSKHFISF